MTEGPGGASPAACPLLFLDVDGTLVPYRGARLPTTEEGWAAWQHASNPQLSRMDPGHGPRLLALPCALVWATAWMGDADTVIAPLLGLPELPVAALPEAPQEYPADVLNWKTAALVRVARGRPFVWVDDSITELDQAWVSVNHPGPALLHRVDALAGLAAADFAVIGDWLRDHLD
ncbi:hypothetical protein ACIGDI_04895 [Streptomyces sp. NPDC085900]|uniref:hypothetical protein n=1 Tax=Streptomyces sp. NPDC085900 TaxID=3365737 RepID=UPI0037D8ADC0